jgi:hypothetical protein
LPTDVLCNPSPIRRISNKILQPPNPDALLNEKCSSPRLLSGFQLKAADIQSNLSINRSVSFSANHMVLPHFGTQ